MRHLAIEPELHRDHRHALELAESGEEPLVTPPIVRNQAVEFVYRQREQVPIAAYDFAVRQCEPGDPATGTFVDRTDRGVGADAGATPGEIVRERADQAILRRAFEKAHLRGVRLAEELAADIEDDLRAHLLGRQELEGERHRHEHLLQHAVRDTELPVPLGVRQAILLRAILRRAEEHRPERLRQRQLLRPTEVVIVEDGGQEMQRSGKRPGPKPEAFARREGIGEDVLFPEDIVVDAQLAHQVEYLDVRAEEDVQAGLDPVAVRVAPR